MEKLTDDKERAMESSEEDKPFVFDECGDFMWDEALEHFEKREQHEPKEVVTAPGDSALSN